MSTVSTPQRRWARFRTFLHLRRRAPSPDPQPSQPASSSNRRGGRRRRGRRTGSDDTRLFSDGRPTSAALRYRRADMDDGVEEGRVESQSSVASALAEIEGIPERDLMAVFNRIVDEYNVDARGPLPQDFHASPMYYGRLPAHTRHRVAMRLHNAYYIAGTRRQAEYSHLTTDLEREFRWIVRAFRANTDGRSQTYDYAASDDQIEALPTFVMEKGEKRSVRQIFASMGVRKGVENEVDEDGESVHGDDADDPCGGMMTSYTECAICLSEFEPGDEITLLPCGHFFHLNGCVREWLRNHARTCPTCRADICTTTSSSDGLASHSATVATSEDIS